MNLKRIGVFIGLMPLLASCATNTIAGTYGFQLGKDTGTHFGFFIDVTDDASKEKEGYKNFTASLNMSMPSDDGQSDDFRKELDKFLSYFQLEGSNIVSLPGYYKVTDVEAANQESVVSVGFATEKVEEGVTKYLQENISETITKEKVDDLIESLPTNLINSIIFATYKTNVLNIYCPVSFEDVSFELYWYGYDIEVSMMDPEKITEDTPVEDIINVTVTEVTKHPLGSHPTKEQIDTINNVLGYEASHDEKFRDFNLLKIGLNKN